MFGSCLNLKLLSGVSNNFKGPGKGWGCAWVVNLCNFFLIRCINVLAKPLIKKKHISKTTILHIKLNSTRSTKVEDLQKKLVENTLS